MYSDKENDRNFNAILYDRCVQLKRQFANFRIRHNFLIFMIIWFKMLFGVFLNIAFLPITNSNQSFGTIRNVWEKLTNLLLDSNQQIFNLCVWSAFIISFIQGFILIFKDSQSAKQKVIIIAFIISIINPILIRYLIISILAQNSQNLTILFKILCFFSILICLIIHIFIQLISCSAKMQNQNLMIHYHNNKLLVKQFISYVLIIVTTVLTQQYGFNNYSSNNKGLLAIIALHVIFAIVPLYVVCSQFLFHSSTAQFGFLFSSCFQFSISLVSLLNSSLPDTIFASNMQLLTLTLTIFLLWGTKQYIDYRNHQIITNQLTSLRLNQLYLSILSDSLMDRTNGAAKLQFIVNTLKNQHQNKCVDVHCVCNMKQNLDNKELYKSNVINDKIREIMDCCANNIQLSLYCCYLKLIFFKSFPDLLSKMKLLRLQTKLSISQQLQYLCFKKQIKNFVDSRKVAACAFQTELIQVHDQLILKLSNKLQQISGNKMDFWISLGKRIPDYSAVNNAIQKQIQLSSQIDQIIPKIYESFHFSLCLLQFINIYQVCIKLKTSMPAELKQAFRDNHISKNQHVKILKKQNFDIKAVMFQKSTVIFQSQIQKTKMGIILNVSKNITHVFGYRKQIIIGQNINQVMPKSMQKQHDVILNSWRERASWANIHKKRYIFAMTKDRICFETAIYVRIVQRLDSVNLLATFFKANQNDFMLVNQDGFIDGLGQNFKKALGSQVAKLPLSAVCQNVQSLISQVKASPQKKKTILTFYHIKGLQQLLQEYQLSRYQITKASCLQTILPEQQIKTKARAVRISVSYEPYRMGNLFFVVIKFLTIHKNFASMDNYGDPNRKQEVQLRQQDFPESSNSLAKSNRNQIQFCEYNSSIHTSTYNLSMSSDSIFLSLRQRVKNSPTFANRSIFYYVLAVLFCFILMAVVLIVEINIELYINDNFDDHSRESLRLFEKFCGLSFAYSRFINLDLKPKMPSFQIQRAGAALDVVLNSFENQHIGLWLEDQWGNKPVLQRLIKYSDTNQDLQTVVMDQFFTIYTDYYKILKQKYMLNQTVNSQQISTLRRQIDENHPTLKSYVQTNIEKLLQFINDDLFHSIVLSRVIFAIFSLFFFGIFYLIWKFQIIKRQHNDEIFNAFLTISDKNCQNCANYFRKVNIIFAQCIGRASQTDNQAIKIQQEIVESNPLMKPLQKFEIESDKFHRKKIMTKILNQNSFKLRIFLFCLFLSLIAVLSVKLVNQEQTYVSNNEYLKNYFEFLDYEKQFVYNFLSVKKIFMMNQSSNSDLNFLQSIKQYQQDQEDSLQFSDYVFNLLKSIKKFNGDQASLLFVLEDNLCNSIKQNDYIYYSQVCINTTYSEMKLFQSHSVVEQSITSTSLSIISGSSNFSKSLTEQIAAEQIINLEFEFIDNFLRDCEQMVTSHYQETVVNLGVVTSMFSVVFIALIVFIILFAKNISKSMTRNCCKILVVPEIVLKNTKGAMKHIDNVLQAII